MASVTSATTLKSVLVTGGNAGIGLALCKQLATEDGCHVYLCARSHDKGVAAVQSILKANPKASVDLIQLDVGNDKSVSSAAATLKGMLKAPLYAIVNNAGAGLAHGVSVDVILNTNVAGPKRVFDAFAPLLDLKKGRVVNMGSGVGPCYVAGSLNGKPIAAATAAQRRTLVDPKVTWDQIQAIIDIERKAKMNALTAYALSKACLAASTLILARTYPNLTSNCCSPGFINTAMCKGFGAKLQPEQGTVSARHLLFKAVGNGWFYGSDGKRSPLHTSRNPGDPEYNPDAKTAAASSS